MKWWNECQTSSSWSFRLWQISWDAQEFNLLLGGAFQWLCPGHPSAQSITVTHSIPGKCVSWGTNGYSLTPITIEKTIEPGKAAWRNQLSRAVERESGKIRKARLCISALTGGSGQTKVAGSRVPCSLKSLVNLGKLVWEACRDNLGIIT